MAEEHLQTWVVCVQVTAQCDQFMHIVSSHDHSNPSAWQQLELLGRPIPPGLYLLLALSHWLPLTLVASLTHTHIHSLSLVLVVMMKSKELKTKIYSHAHSLILSHRLSQTGSLCHDMSLSSAVLLMVRLSHWLSLSRYDGLPLSRSVPLTGFFCTDSYPRGGEALWEPIAVLRAQIDSLAVSMESVRRLEHQRIARVEEQWTHTSIQSDQQHHQQRLASVADVSSLQRQLRAEIAEKHELQAQNEQSYHMMVKPQLARVQELEDANHHLQLQLQTVTTERDAARAEAAAQQNFATEHQKELDYHRSVANASMQLSLQAPAANAGVSDAPDELQKLRTQLASDLQALNRVSESTVPILRGVRPQDAFTHELQQYGGQLHEYRMEKINSPLQSAAAMSPPMSPLAAAAAPHMHPQIEPLYQHWSDGSRTVLAPMAHGPPLELPGFMSPEQVCVQLGWLGFFSRKCALLLKQSLILSGFFLLKHSLSLVRVVTQDQDLFSCTFSDSL